MTHIDPRVPDPRFPDRPQHEDYYALSEAVQKMDARAEAGVPLPQIAEVDMESLLYLIRNRLGMARSRWSGAPRAISDEVIYLDAFVLGKLYAEGQAQRTKEE